MSGMTVKGLFAAAAVVLLGLFAAAAVVLLVGCSSSEVQLETEETSPAQSDEMRAQSEQMRRILQGTIPPSAPPGAGAPANP
jgi:hypothetical protein